MIHTSKPKPTLKSRVLYFIAMLVIFSSCADRDDLAVNPLLQKWDTPYGVPPFDLIHARHFEPAILHLVDELEKEVERIVGQEEAATFENTVLPLERSKNKLGKIEVLLMNLTGVNASDELQEVQKVVIPKQAYAKNIVQLNSDLFDRIQSLWNRRDILHLSGEDQKLLEHYYLDFTRNGVLLNNSQKERLKVINEEISKLSFQFNNNVLAERNAYQLIIDKEEDLSGLPDDLIKVAKTKSENQDLKDSWVFTLEEPIYYPFMEYASNRARRKELYEARSNIGNNGNEYDNNINIRQIVDLRREKAQLLGYPTHAHFKQEPNMLKNPEAVQTFLIELWNSTFNKVNERLQDFDSLMKMDGIDDSPKLFDLPYYRKKLENQQIEFDENEVRPYFSMENLNKGMFEVANKLYGLEFELVKDIPIYHEEVQAYEVKEETGKVLGIIYMDLYPRPSKQGGYWMTAYNLPNLDPDDEESLPITVLTGNFPSPTSDSPSLLSLYESRILFHEFGHVLHGLITETKHVSLNFHKVATDFLELPSTIMENWAMQPEVVVAMGSHHRSGEPIPKKIVDKIIEYDKFTNESFIMNLIFPSLLDLEYHSIKETTEDLDEIPNRVRKKLGLENRDFPINDKVTSFLHIFAGRYDAAFYSYLWSKVLEADAFEAFQEKGDIFDREVAESFRRELLAKGASADPMEMFINFRGREPSIDVLARRMGWLEDKETEIRKP